MMRRLLPVQALVLLAACNAVISEPKKISTDPTGDDDGPCVPTGVISASPMIRISRAQADNLTRDLLGASFVPSTVLGTDEKLGPFAVNGQTAMSQDLAAQYQFVAESIGDEVEKNVQKFAPCTGSGTVSAAAACATSFVKDFGRRAFRRPLDTDTLARWSALYTAEASAAGYAGGIRAVVEGMLQSPDFIYRVEMLRSGMTPDTTDAWTIDLEALATRLSFFLWNSGPDTELLAAADDGTLADAAVYSAQVDRMLKDPRGKYTSQAFAEAWAGMDQLLAAASSPGRLGPLDPSLVPMMHDETVGLIDQVMRQGKGTLSTLFQSDLSPAAPLLASTIYNVTAPADANGDIKHVAGQGFGILTQASMLFAHAHSEQTSPVLRGRWLRETLFCQPVPDPPPTVLAIPPAPVPGQTTRERFEAHRTDPSCAACHKLLDPLGFGLESFDQYGRHRDTDSGQPVDDTGTLIGTDVDGDYKGVSGLAAKIATSKEASTCFAQQWFRYALGHAESNHDECTVKLMSKAATATGYSDMVKALVTADAFTQRRSP